MIRFPYSIPVNTPSSDDFFDYPDCINAPSNVPRHFIDYKLIVEFNGPIRIPPTLPLSQVLTWHLTIPLHQHPSRDPYVAPLRTPISGRHQSWWKSCAYIHPMYTLVLR